MLDALSIQDPFSAWADIPAEIQTVVRADSAQQFCFLLNFTSQPQEVTFKESTFDLLAEQKLVGQTEIPPYGVRFVRY